MAYDKKTLLFRLRNEGRVAATTTIHDIRLIAADYIEILHDRLEACSRTKTEQINQLQAENENLKEFARQARSFCQKIIELKKLEFGEKTKVNWLFEEAEKASAREIVSVLEGSDAEAASFASACVLEAAEAEDAEPLAEALERQLKIYDLERRIASGKAR